VNTDAFGLFNLVVGAGAVQSGSMATIYWGMDNYYLKVDMDVTGGTNFLTMGTTQLLSVPYALYAKTAESLNNIGSFNHYIGEQYGGGVIFHLWKDEFGWEEHGLIVDITDLSIEQYWSSAVDLCLNSTSGYEDDWYLPSADELSLLWHSRFDVNIALSTMYGATVLPVVGLYWSSSEVDSYIALGLSFETGTLFQHSKDWPISVRAVRAF